MNDGEALLRELRFTLADIFKGQQGSEEGNKGIVLGEGSQSNRILFAIENCLTFGFNPTQQYPKPFVSILVKLAVGPPLPTPFDWIENLPSCLPGTQKLIDISKAGKNGISKLRLFIRAALNEGQLSECIRALSWDNSNTSKHYNQYAIVREPVLIAQFVTRLETLSVVHFDLQTTELALELSKIDYWQTVDLRPSIPNNSIPSVSIPTTTTTTIVATTSQTIAPSTTNTTAAFTITGEEEEEKKEITTQQQNNTNVNGIPATDQLEQERKALEEKLKQLGISL